MSKKIIIFISISVFVYAIAATSILHFYKDDPAYMDLADRQEFNLKYFNSISAESIVSTSAVIDYLGSPDITQAKEVNKTIYQVMFYRTKELKADGFTSIDECMGLLFLDGLLIAWGKDAYTQYKSY